MIDGKIYNVCITIYLYYLILLSDMESISLKLEMSFLKSIEKTMKIHKYTTKTEFIREAIRDKMKQLEKEEAIKRLVRYKGAFKPVMSEEEAGRIAVEKIAKRLGVKLD